MKVLFVNAFPVTAEQIEKINRLDYEVCLWNEEGAHMFDADVVVSGGGFLQKHLEQFTQLKLIQLVSAGFDNVPLREIQARDIVLTNARGVYSVPIAEWVILKVLEIYKQTQHFAAAQRRSEWNKNVDILELNGKTMGIIGTGSIGVEVAKRANAFGCKVIGLNTRGRNVAFFNTCWPRTQLHDFLPQCDIVVLTLPFTEQVKDLLNRGTLPLMKEGAVLINIARGGIINEADLLDILSSGSLRGVALDVFEEEPLPSDNPLWQHERVLVTPHISFASEQIAQRMHALVYANLKALQGLQEWENVVEICREIRE